MVGVFLRRLVLRGLRRGAGDGSRGWMLVGVVAGLAVLARRVRDEPPELLAREVVEPGQRLLISVADPEAP